MGTLKLTSIANVYNHIKHKTPPKLSKNDFKGIKQSSAEIRKLLINRIGNPILSFRVETINSGIGNQKRTYKTRKPTLDGHSVFILSSAL